jgi:hypothetical protein
MGNCSVLTNYSVLIALSQNISSAGDFNKAIFTYLDGEPMVSDGLRCVCLMLMFRVGTGVSVRR